MKMENLFPEERSDKSTVCSVLLFLRPDIPYRKETTQTIHYQQNEQRINP